MFIKFCISHSQVKCIVATAVFVCLCFCLSVFRHIPTLLHGPRCDFEEWWGCPLVVHYGEDLQSVQGVKHMRLMRNVSEDACTRCVGGYPCWTHTDIDISRCFRVKGQLADPGLSAKWLL